MTLSCSFPLRMTFVLSQAMALGTLGLLACGQADTASGPAIAQQQQPVISPAGSNPNIQAPVVAPPVRPTSSGALQKSIQPSVEKAPRVLYRGCRAIRTTPDGPICMPSATSRTTLWVEGQACEKLEVIEDGQVRPFTTEYVRGGCRLKQKDVSQPLRSTLALRFKDSSIPFWSLQMDRSISGLFEWTEKMWARSTSDLTGVEAELRDLSLGASRPEQLIDLAYARAIALMRQGDILGAVAAMAKVTELAKRHGFPSVAFEAAHRRMTYLRHAGLPDEAALLLQDSESLLTPGLSHDEMRWPWNKGLILQMQDQMEAAEPWLRKAAESAERLEEVGYLQNVLPVWADVLRSLNRPSEAEGILVLATEFLSGATGCAKTGLLANLGWLHLQLWQIQSLSSSKLQPVARLSSADQMLHQGLESLRACPDATLKGNILSGLAHVAFLDGRIADVRANLAATRNQPGLSVIDQMELIEVEARTALLSQHPAESQRLLQELEALSRRHLNHRRQMTQCRIAAGLFEAKQMLGDDFSQVATQLHDCLDERMGLASYERLLLRQRAKSAGIILP